MNADGSAQTLTRDNTAGTALRVLAAVSFCHFSTI